jgi:hypothetical protein
MTYKSSSLRTSVSDFKTNRWLKIQKDSKISMEKLYMLADMRVKALPLLVKSKNQPYF